MLLPELELVERFHKEMLNLLELSSTAPTITLPTTAAAMERV